LTLPEFPARWRLRAPTLLTETFSSRIWKVRLSAGADAIVKDLKPFDDVEDELRGAHYLAWRDGRGAVRLIDRESNFMLLEYAGERHLRAVLDREGDDAATEIAASVLGELTAPSDQPFPADLQPLRARFESLFSKAAADRAIGRTGLYAEAAEIAERLVAEPRRLCPLHGDLHHDNIIEGPRGWLAIDPKGVLGDPAFDAANMLYNPLERDDLCLDPKRITHMAGVFARVLHVEPRHILDHAIAYGCLSAAWHAADGNAKDEARELAIAEVIRSVR
jgi:streptomycin 6-kinase